MNAIFGTKLKQLINKLLLLLTVVLLSACGGLYSDEDLAEFEQEIQIFLKENNWTAERSESGLYLEVLEEGTGQPIPIDAKVLVTYKGSLINGQSFDQTGAEPVLLHTRTLIDGWREALLSLNVGGSARMVIPPNLGYKNQELPKIPKNSILVFEIKIHNIQ